MLSKLKQLYMRFFLSAASKLAVIIGDIHGLWTHKKITGQDYFEVYDLAQEGDILLSYTEGELSNLFIPKFWGHSAWIKNKDFVIEATRKGVVESNMVDFMMKKDRVKLLRPNFMSPEQKSTATGIAMLQIGKPYDYRFGTGNINKFYCSELVWYVIGIALGGLEMNPIKLNKNYGVESLAPADLDDPKLFNTIWESKY